MAKIFAILTALLLAASAYIANKNKGAYSDKVDKRQAAEKKLAKSQSKLASVQEQYDASIAEMAQTKVDTTSLRQQQQQQESKNAKLSSDITSKTALSDEQAAKIAEIEEQTKGAGEIEQLAGKIERLQEEIVAYEDEKASKEIQRSNLLAERNSTEKTIKSFADESRYITSKKSYGSARISSIFGPWGFVTLSSGSAGGIVSGSTLNVVRGGETVAELRVRSVEANRASADVVPSSLGEDVALMVGDNVVPAETKAN